MRYMVKNETTTFILIRIEVFQLCLNDIEYLELEFKKFERDWEKNLHNIEKGELRNDNKLLNYQ